MHSKTCILKLGCNGKQDINNQRNNLNGLVLATSYTAIIVSETLVAGSATKKICVTKKLSLAIFKLMPLKFSQKLMMKSANAVLRDFAFHSAPHCFYP